MDSDVVLNIETLMGSPTKAKGNVQFLVREANAFCHVIGWQELNYHAVACPQLVPSLLSTISNCDILGRRNLNRFLRQ